MVVHVPKVLISGVGAVGPKGEEKQREQREDGEKEGNWARNEETYRVGSRRGRRRKRKREREGGGGEEGKNEVMESPGAAFCSKNRGCW